MDLIKKKKGIEKNMKFFMGCLCIANIICLIINIGLGQWQNLPINFFATICCAGAAILND